MVDEDGDNDSTICRPGTAAASVLQEELSMSIGRESPLLPLLKKTTLAGRVRRMRVNPMTVGEALIRPVTMWAVLAIWAATIRGVMVVRSAHVYEYKSQGKKSTLWCMVPYNIGRH